MDSFNSARVSASSIASSTVPDVARLLHLKPQRAKGKTEWHGPNPSGQGATRDGFILYLEGNAFDRNSQQKYSCFEVAKLAGIAPEQYAPYAQYRARNSTGGLLRSSYDVQRVAAQSKSKPRFDWEQARIFEYFDANGVLVMQVGRIDYPDGKKEFRQRRPNEKGNWLYNLEGIVRPLYNLLDVLEAETVLLCEGEQVAERLNEDLRAMGCYGPNVASTSAQGSSSFHLTDATPLYGKNVVVLPDNDAAGEKYREAVLTAIGGHSTVKVVELPDRGESGDYIDFCKAGGTLEIALDLIDAAPLWEAPKPKPDFETFTLSQMLELPREKWLIRGVLEQGITSVLAADSGAFKSFVALDMALSVATGNDWQGRVVKQGNVVYVAAEAFRTFAERASAWSIAHECELPENVLFLQVPIDLSDAAVVERFIAQFEQLNPDFVILDTLSQCAAGHNENDNALMALFIRGMTATAQRLGAHTMVVHHNAKGGELFRGAGAIKANVDAMISLTRPDEDDTVVFLKSTKSKGRGFDEFALKGREVETPLRDEFGDVVSSLVFELAGEAARKVEKTSNQKRVNKTRDKLLEIFDECAKEAEKFGGGVKIGFWHAAVEANGEVSTPTFWRHRKELEKSGEIIEVGEHNGSPTYLRKPPLSSLSPLSNESSESALNLLSSLSQPFRGDSDDSESSVRSERKSKNESESGDSNESRSRKASAANRAKPRKAINHPDFEPYKRPLTPKIELAEDEFDIFDDRPEAVENA